MVPVLTKLQKEADKTKYLSGSTKKLFKANLNNCNLLTSSTVPEIIKAPNLTVKSDSRVKLLGISIYS